MPRNDDAVRETAYYLWQQAGEPAGESLRFWLEAEEEFACHGDMTSEDAELGKGPDGSPTASKQSKSPTTGDPAPSSVPTPPAYGKSPKTSRV